MTLHARVLLGFLGLWVGLLIAWVPAEEAPVNPKAAKKPVPADHAQRVKKGTALFKSDVRAILVKNCLECHGGKSVKADFDLSTRKKLMDSGYVDETAQDSYLMQLITHAEEPHMPLKRDRLPEASIELIRQWIDLGSPYDQPLIEAKPADAPKAMQVTEHDR
jgi:cytochrome c553